MKWTTLASIGFLLAPSTSYTQVDIEAGETRLQALMPVPFRCQRSELEQLFWCRHQTDTARSVALELTLASDVFSSSLTYTIDDPQGGELLNIVKRYFSQFGVSGPAFDRCIRELPWQATEALVGHLLVRCRAVELGHRVTYEVFASHNHTVGSGEVPVQENAERPAARKPHQRTSEVIEEADVR